ncbi:transglutaminase 5, like [Entelurus aequoreus]|uniref:transglutaminase 5, like n=1 Tax=Entelurus aequoreus TaxID=161455 RepID=UPI002B1D976B|nr:transglutaminase 5, like [Entelurus aequoreus]
MHKVDLEISENLERHRTAGFSGSKTLVVRRGDPFKVSLPLGTRPYDPSTDTLWVKVLLGRLYVLMPVTLSTKFSLCRWGAFMDPDSLNPNNLTIFISAPASASVGQYKFKLWVFAKGKTTVCAVGKFILLCNPWCQADSVYIPFEDQREEYIHNDSCLLFMGTAKNIVSRPWSLDQFEPYVLEACLNLLNVSPHHQHNRRKDYLNRSNPVYISRVVSAMINCEDDRGVLKGNWSEDFDDGVHPSKWTGSSDILRRWAKSGYHPIKYGQCWVYAAVMCTVMRVLGIPCRVVTNFNSAHDTNGNLVIEEFYSETGQKLKSTKDSIWNFHVWVECWMTRKDLEGDLDGWQILDPTPQKRSGGVFCCGPAPAKAIKERRVDLFYDIPFVYAEVNADVHTLVVSKGRVVSRSVDKDRVGPLICTKAVGLPRMQNVTGDYKHVKSLTSTMSSNRSSMSSNRSSVSENSTPRRGTKRLAALLTLDKTPVAGTSILFALKVVNRQSAAKMMKVHLNAQTKEYNNSPSETFWEAHKVIELAPLEVKVLKQQILPFQYEDVVGDNLVNLAAVLEDMVTQERVLAFEEFNIANPQLVIEIEGGETVAVNKEQAASVTFTNPFCHPVSGLLSVSGSSLIKGHANFRMFSLRPGGSGKQRINFLPSMKGTKMLQASLTLSNKTTITGFKMVTVRHV